ncbi:MAG: hypothetical protein R3338_15500, partial [Thermoanaerobaculia bacterium]|nr:hypothetical protein [Thermoanaerobaculia bacterium]
IVVPSDRTLVDQSSLIVAGSVLATTPAPETPRTDVLISVSASLKGEPGSPTITVRIPGGETPDGMRLRVWGTPRFEAGQEVLLFLGPRRDHVHRPLHLSVGVFHLTGTGQGGYAIRDFGEAAIISYADDNSPDGSLIRRRDAFVSWIIERVDGHDRPAHYWEAPSPYLSAQAPFTLFRSPTSGLNMRWFAFQEGDSVSWYMQLPDFGPGSPTLAQLEHAVAAWNEAPGTLIRYDAAGATDATNGLEDFDGINAVIFGDPNDEVEGTFSCSLGGVLAIGGPWFGSSKFPFREREVHRTIGADIIMNDGIECAVGTPNSLKNLEEVIAHELGHTLGFGHSCGDDKSGKCSSGSVQADALMRTTAHHDGRGAKLNSDDIAAAVELYPEPVSTPTPTRRRTVTRP